MDSGFPWLILVAVVVVGIIVYVAFMIFLPEWVGITGETALKNEREAAGDAPESDVNPLGLSNPAESTDVKTPPHKK
jgi:uncharacterized membrane protein YcjF (UPF0283 family)